MRFIIFRISFPRSLVTRRRSRSLIQSSKRIYLEVESDSKIFKKTVSPEEFWRKKKNGFLTMKIVQMEEIRIRQTISIVKAIWSMMNTQQKYLNTCIPQRWEKVLIQTICLLSRLTSPPVCAQS